MLGFIFYLRTPQIKSQQTNDWLLKKKPIVFRMFTIKNEKCHNLFPKGVKNERVSASVMFTLCSHVKQYGNILLNVKQGYISLGAQRILVRMIV